MDRGRIACRASLALLAWLSCAHGGEPPTPAAPALGLAPGPEPGPEFAAAPPCGASPPAFRWPARGRVTSAFGPRDGRPHRGIDISAIHRDLAVRAAAAGTVRLSGVRRGYGRVVILRHAGGYESVYAHNQDNLVWEGARVEAGQVIADMGSTGHVTGPHLHFEIRLDGRAVDPLACLPARSRRS